MSYFDVDIVMYTTVSTLYCKSINPESEDQKISLACVFDHMLFTAAWIRVYKRQSARLSNTEQASSVIKGY